MQIAWSWIGIGLLNIGMAVVDYANGDDVLAFVIHGAFGMACFFVAQFFGGKH